MIMTVEGRRWKVAAENRGFHPCQSFHVKSVSPPAHLKCHLFQEEEKNILPRLHGVAVRLQLLLRFIPHIEVVGL